MPKSGGGAIPHVPPHASQAQVAAAKYAEEQEEEQLKVDVLGVSEDGPGTDLEITYRAAKGTPYVTVHVQSTVAGEGGKSYSASNFTSDTRYDTRNTIKRTVTVPRAEAEHYWVWLIPAVDIDGCGNFVEFGPNGEDRSSLIHSGPDTVYPSIDAQTSQSGSTGTLDLSIFDGELRVTAVEFKKKTDAGGFGGSWLSGISPEWDSGSGTAGNDESLTRSEDIALKEKHNVGIKWRVTFTGPNGTSRTISDTHIFDIDLIPEITKFVARQDSAGNIVTSGTMDEDCDSVLITVTTDGSEPADPTSGSEDDSVNPGGKRWQANDTGVDASQGDIVRLKARGVDSSGTEAPPEHIVPYEFEAPGAAATGEDPTVRLREDSRTVNDITYDLYVESGGNIADPDMRYRTRVDKEGSLGDWSAWTSVADADDGTWIDQEITKNRDALHDRTLWVELQDQAGQGDPSAFVSHTIYGLINFRSNGYIDGTTMQIDDGSTNTATPGGVIPSTSSPSGDYPEKSLWAVV